MVPNKNNDFIPMRTVTSWSVCMDYRKLNGWTKKDQFLMPLIDQILDHLAGRGWNYFLDYYSGYN